MWNVHSAYHSKKKKIKDHNHRENEMTKQNKFIKLWNEWKKEKKGGGDKDHVLKKKFHWSFSFELKK